MSPTQSAGAQLHPRSRPFWGAGWPRCMQDSLAVCCMQDSLAAESSERSLAVYRPASQPVKPACRVAWRCCLSRSSVARRLGAIWDSTMLAVLRASASVVLDIFINRSTDQMNSDFGGVLSPIFRSEYGQSIQMQYICVSFLAKSQLRERGVSLQL